MILKRNELEIKIENKDVSPLSIFRACHPLYTTWAIITQTKSVEHNQSHSPIISTYSSQNYYSFHFNKFKVRSHRFIFTLAVSSWCCGIRCGLMAFL